MNTFLLNAQKLLSEYSKSSSENEFSFLNFSFKKCPTPSCWLISENNQFIQTSNKTSNIPFLYIIRNILRHAGDENKLRERIITAAAE